MAYVAPSSRSSGDTITHTIWNQDVVENVIAVKAEVDAVETDVTSLDSRVTPSSSSVITSQTTTSTSFTDLATNGPAVTVTTGTSALVQFDVCMANSGANSCWVGVAVSGATTQAASEDQSLQTTGTNTVQFGGSYIVSGLTAGSNTFTLKYKVSGGTGTFLRRHIIVTPMADLA